MLFSLIFDNYLESCQKIEQLVTGSYVERILAQVINYFFDDLKNN